jgi:4-diphosphocytidyl-2-C-methyl-D-erythritol kinase
MGSVADKPSVTARAPAKINLALSVGPRRQDGFHELATVFQAVSVYDVLVAEPGEQVTVTVEGAQAKLVPTGDENLAARAAQVLAAYAGVTTGARLHLRKSIPVAGGMAGGSADAAAALVACDALWGTGLGRAELSVLAARVGSDVPFALLGGTALATGRGERLTPAMVGGTFHWVLAVAEAGLGTPRVYAELDRIRAGKSVAGPAVAPDVLAALRSGEPEALGVLLDNDLQAAAFGLTPGLEATLETGMGLGALGAVVSGSGPTCAFLVHDAEHGLDVAVGLAAAEVAADVIRASGPVPGARLVT